MGDTATIPALRGLRQGDCEFKASLGYILRTCTGKCIHICKYIIQCDKIYIKICSEEKSSWKEMEQMTGSIFWQLHFRGVSPQLCI
jgi:hypothetical protein